MLGCSSKTGAPSEDPPGAPEPFSVMTFNVLCSVCDGSFAPWDERLKDFGDIFKRYDADLYALQELIPPLANHDEVQQMKALLPGYEALYWQPGENDSGLAYPDATILYRVARFEVVQNGFYWLSPTPDVPRSTGFQPKGQIPRLVAWAVFKDKKSRRKFFFAGTHVDNNAPSQELSAPLILARTAPFEAQMPAIQTGDFNSTPSTKAYDILTKSGTPFVFENSQALAKKWHINTNQSPEPAYDLSQRIDHVFVAPKGFTVDEWAADLYQYGMPAKYPSDHFAIFARMTAPAL